MSLVIKQSIFKGYENKPGKRGVLGDELFVLR